MIAAVSMKSGMSVQGVFLSEYKDKKQKMQGSC